MFDQLSCYHMTNQQSVIADNKYELIRNMFLFILIEHYPPSYRKQFTMITIEQFIDKYLGFAKVMPP